jgi:hypothetical protein
VADIGGPDQTDEPNVPAKPDSVRLRPGQDVGGTWWTDDWLRGERLADQVADLVKALTSEDAGTSIVVANEAHEALGPERYGEMSYLLAQGRVLVRDEDLARVAEIVGRSPHDTFPDGINGLSILPVDNALDALARVDRALGTGIAFPDHVIYVTGPGGSACPATEPLPTKAQGPEPRGCSHKRCSGEGVRIAVVDTGFDAETAAHTPWLAGVTGEQEVIDPLDLGHYTGHGTFVAGVVRSVAPRAQIHVHAFLPRGGAILESQIVAKLEAALESNPDIVSMSAGARTRGHHGLLGFRKAWEHYARKGTLLVSAAGNDASTQEFYPAADEYAVGVGAVDRRGRRAPYSNYGPWVDCFARGSDVVNAFPNGIYRYKERPRTGHYAEFDHWLGQWSGTSFATPLVSGMVAARMSHSGESAPAAMAALAQIARKRVRPGRPLVLDPRMACLDA